MENEKVLLTVTLTNEGEIKLNFNEIYGGSFCIEQREKITNYISELTEAALKDYLLNN